MIPEKQVVAMETEKRTQVIARLVLDLGKIIFAASVVGYFVPAFPGQVNGYTFLGGVLVSGALFAVGIKLTQ